MKKYYDKLEFNTILDRLADFAQSESAKNQCRALKPMMNEDACRRKMAETTAARSILDTHGSPPITAMQDLDAILTLAKAGAMLVPDQLTRVDQFLAACLRMRQYLKKAAETDAAIAACGDSFFLLPELRDEIARCIRAGGVDDAASTALQSVHRKIERTRGQIQSQLASLVQSKRQMLSDGAVVQRGGRYVLPVRREYKSKISGAVVDMSGTGATVFIEPAAVAKLGDQLAGLQVEADNEVRRILYTLTAQVDRQAHPLHINIEAMETLDFLFARAKLSASMAAGPVAITAERRLCLKGARHPLLPKDTSVPLSLSMDKISRGVIITGPNTGGKTVALKTVGLLSLMAQSGLHVTAAPESVVCMHSAYLCDLGDGQSISENLSTFSSHMTVIIDILEKADGESLVLLDELGSGTDPAEGMGIAVAVLEALRRTGCMLVATTHYPEVKQYADKAGGYTNARMAFDRQTLQPTYRLEVGQAGESCALYIAQRLGLPAHILDRAQREACKGETDPASEEVIASDPGESEDPLAGMTHAKAGKIQATVEPKNQSAHAAGFGCGDSVLVFPKREPGIVFHAANPRGEVGVQVKGEKQWLPHKRLRLVAKAESLYPPDYDFAVVFDSVENRKARKQMEKKHVAGTVIHHDTFGWSGN